MHLKIENINFIFNDCRLLFSSEFYNFVSKSICEMSYFKKSGSIRKFQVKTTCTQQVYILRQRIFSEPHETDQLSALLQPAILEVLPNE